MAEVKIFAKWLADFLGISSFFLGWVSNLDNVKSTILFIVGLIYIMVRLYFMIVRGLELTKLKRIETEIKELERQEKHNEINKKPA